MHRIAEHVLAAARFADDGEIRLTAHDGGFATPLLSDGRRVRVAGTTIVVDGPGGSRAQDIDSVGSAASFVGIEPGFPSQLYAPATTFVADEPLRLDAAAAAALAAWYGFTDAVVRTFAAEIVGVVPSPLILWPEHFDQAIFTEDADEAARANYGASPGDDGHPAPYLYVGPWSAPAADPYWNATQFSGSVMSVSAVSAAEDPTAVALAFLRAGRARLVRGDEMTR